MAKKLFGFYLYDDDLERIAELKVMYARLYGMQIKDTSQLLRMLIKKDYDELLGNLKKNVANM